MEELLMCDGEVWWASKMDGHWFGMVADQARRDLDDDWASQDDATLGDESAILRRFTSSYGGESIEIRVQDGTLTMAIFRATCAAVGPMSEPTRVRQIGVELIERESTSRVGPTSQCFSWRIKRPTDCRRNPFDRDRFMRSLQGSLLRPDLTALGRELDALEISKLGWLGAFGLSLPQQERQRPGEGAAILPDLESVICAILTRQEVVPGQRRVVEKLLDLEEGSLPTRRLKKPGETARRLARWIAAVEGEPSLRNDAGWETRRLAVDLTNRILEGPAVNRLIAEGCDHGRMLSGAAMARLLGHYDESLARDPLFHLMMGRLAETWKTQDYAESFFRLAENAHRAGFTLIVFPQPLERAIWRRFGMTGEVVDNRVSTARQGWSAEAVIDLASPAEHFVKLCEMLDAERSDGLVLRCEADGTHQLIGFQGGRPGLLHGQVLPGIPIRLDLLEHAARSLWPRSAILALGFEDLFEPGPMKPRIHRPDSIEHPVNDMPAEVKRLAERTLASLPPPTFIPSVTSLSTELPEAIRARPGAFATLNLTIPTNDTTFLRELCAELSAFTARRFSAHPGFVQLEGRELWIVHQSLILHAILRILGDLPSGTRIALGARGHSSHFVISPKKG